MNNILTFPKPHTYDFCGIEIWDYSAKEWQVAENSDIIPEVQPLQPNSEEQIKSILDMQVKINYYLSEIEIFSRK